MGEETLFQTSARRLSGQTVQLRFSAPMVLIEVQTGAYVNEDDIVRYEDVYARG